MTRSHPGTVARLGRHLLPDTPLQLLLLLLWVPLVAIVHELGHALWAGPGGFRVTSFGIGRGRPMVRVGLPGGVVFHVGWLFFTGGACVAIPRTPESGPRAALFHGGGIAAQIALGLGLLCIPDGPLSGWLDAGGRFNLLVAGWNLLPWRTGRMASDGWWLLSRLTRGAVAPRRALFEQREALQRVLAYEQRVGSPVGIWYGHRMLAWCDLLAGRTASAIERLAQVPPLPITDPHLESIDALIRTEAHLRSGHAMVALRTIEEVHRSAPLAPETADLFNVVEARAWLALGDVRRARQSVGKLAGLGGTIGREAASVSLTIAVATDDLQSVHATATRLSRSSTAGLFDPLSAARALASAAALAPDVATAARWKARAVGIVRAAWHRASAEDKPAIQNELDRLLHDTQTRDSTDASAMPEGHSAGLSR